MSIAAEFDHESMHVFKDSETGLAGVVAIHSTRLGPAAGGLRLAPYESLEQAIDDALRLARAMTLKNAAAGLELGGGKAVLIDDGCWQDRAIRMRAFGRVLDGLGGRYITAEDVGTSPADMELIAETTPYVAGRPTRQGDPSAATARTVFHAISDAAQIELDRDLDDLRIGVIGTGHVGSRLVALLRAAGAHVDLTDIDPARARDVAAVNGAHARPLDRFTEREMDVLAPCALGGLIGPDQVPRLRCAIVAGAANNPLTTSGIADQLADRGITYVPDFLANSGGIIHIAAEILGFDQAEVERRLSAATAQTRRVLQESAANGRVPLAIAHDLVAARLGASTSHYTGQTAGKILSATESN